MTNTKNVPNIIREQFYSKGRKYPAIKGDVVFIRQIRAECVNKQET